MSLCTVDDVIAYLNLQEVSDLSLIDSLVDSAQGLIERYTGRTFDVSTDTVRYYRPAASVRYTTLYVDELAAAPTTVVNSDGATLAGTDYVTEPRNEPPYTKLRLLSASGVSWAAGTSIDAEITITGKFGYSTTPPADIRHAAIRLTGWLYRQRDNAPDADRTVVTPGGTILPATMPRDIVDMLTPYRRLT